MERTCKDVAESVTCYILDYRFGVHCPVIQPSA